MSDLPDFIKLRMDQEERDCTHDLVEILKLPREFKTRLWDVAKKTNNNQLSLIVFNNAFPNFPFYLLTSSNRRLKEFGKIATFLNPIRRKKQVAKFLSIIDAAKFEAGGRLVGYIARLPHTQGVVIFHNGEPPSVGDCSPVHFVVAGEDSPPYVKYVVVENLNDFLSRYRFPISEFLNAPLWTGY